MSIDNLNLSGYLYQNLYPHSLVAEGGTPEKINTDEVVTYSFLGENKKNVLVLVNDNNHDYAGKDEIELLQNMLRACKFSLNDVAIVNLKKDKAELTGLKQFFSPAKVIVFGSSILDFPKGNHPVQLLQREGLDFLVGPDLSSFIKDPPLKKPLWEKLQVFFQINNK